MATLAHQIGFIGAGQMATALAGGFVRAGLVEGRQIAAFDASPAALDAFVKYVPGARRATDNVQVLSQADVAVIAVKPQSMAGVLGEMALAASDRQLIISIAAGVKLQTLAECLSAGGRLVRVMPNTPCLVGQSASGYSLGRGATTEDGQLVQQLLTAVGRAFLLDEKHLDAVTGLSGSGPAYIYTVIEALSDGGVLMGLPRDVATTLAAQTVLGAAQMVLQTGEHPAVLRDKVTSPGGTTIAGLAQLEAGALRHTLINAITAATHRATELGKKP